MSARKEIYLTPNDSFKETMIKGLLTNECGFLI